MTSLISKSIFLLVFLFFSNICLSFSISSDYPILSDDNVDKFDKFTSEEDIRELFRMWQKKYEREYGSRDEKENRFQIFKSNFKYIVEKNAKTTSYRLGLNQFSDLTFEEFSKTYLGHQQPIIEDNIDNDGNMESNNDFCPDAPPSIDWRVFGAVTPVKNQGKCGSCWAFSTTGATEGIYKIATGNLVSVSEQQLMSCEPYNLGCEKGGWYTRGFEYVVQNGGIATEKDYPYTEKDGSCDHEKEKLIAATIDGYVNKTYRSESALFCAAAKQPVSISVNVTRDFSYYQQGIFDDSIIREERPCKVNHALLLVGYGSIFGQHYWIVKNSWGYTWGQDGYIFIRRNLNVPDGVSNINCFAAYPTKGFEPSLDSAI
ncbi:zingipain-2-like [Prosopis cineraria]|uniref:zingipain-2-like n=1 Tax=Prosopis cineraria TaxID=364024 RepID=UPI002410B497|nr:zingipain-2-like [Prosopis cineraria]